MKLVTTSVVRGSHQGESHGGVYLIDLESREVTQALDWNHAGIDWQGRGWDRGLRGIAFDGGLVYIAASDELFAFSPDFRRVGSWRNAYLKHCHEIAVWERRLYLASTGCDSVLAFDLDAKEFSWGMQVVTSKFKFQGRAFDPRKDDGPLMLNKLHLNNLHCTRGGLYISGMRTGGMLLFNGREVNMAVELPPGTHNARPFRNGVLFNDTAANLLRYADRDGREDRAMPVPTYPAESLLHADMDQSGLARQGFARGLAVLSDSVVAGGSSPSTVTVYDLAGNQRLLSVNLTMDVRNAIHGLEVWPY
ncbi:MAG TPA: hypothetical protein VFM30_11695 [Steroidobacteraceae bacterium]|nr:hypothetical protein [Steroidobacteraceae bacterium]